MSALFRIQAHARETRLPVRLVNDPGPLEEAEALAFCEEFSNFFVGLHLEPNPTPAESGEP